MANCGPCSPWPLNRQAGSGWGVPVVGRNPGLRFLLQQPYWAGKPAALAKSVGLKKPIRSPIAIQPPRQFARMVAQAATFTIHPSPSQGRSITSVLPDPKHLVRYIVPAASKPDLRAGLRALGVHDLSLFPDLEGLSRHIAFDDRIIGYGPPSPPLCSGVFDQPETKSPRTGSAFDGGSSGVNEGSRSPPMKQHGGIVGDATFRNASATVCTPSASAVRRRRRPRGRRTARAAVLGWSTSPLRSAVVPRLTIVEGASSPRPRPVRHRRLPPQRPSHSVPVMPLSPPRRSGSPCSMDF